MVGDHHQPPAGFQHLEALLQRHFQRLHLAVDLDAERLKELGQEFGFVLPGGAGLHRRDQLRRGGHRLRGPGLRQTVGDLPRGFDLAPVAQNAGQLLRGRQSSPLVHAHVERRLATERKAPFEGVEMVRRDPQVGQNAVHLPHAAQPQRAPQEAEIALHIVEPRVVGAVGQRIAVLIEAVKTPFGTQSGEDAARMAASAESEVGVGARGINTEQRHRLFQQHGSMILRHNGCFQRSIWV